jgi:Uncharacterized protein conserved in bacteria
MDEHSKPQDDVPRQQQDENTVKKYAFVSKRALENDHIGYCYRDYPETNIDSGWRFLYGDEDETYLDNPTNSEAIYPEDMLSISPALDPILSAPINSEYEWDDENQTYIEILNLP